MNIKIDQSTEVNTRVINNDLKSRLGGRLKFNNEFLTYDIGYTKLVYKNAGKTIKMRKDIDNQVKYIIKLKEHIKTLELLAYYFRVDSKTSELYPVGFPFKHLRPHKLCEYSSTVEYSNTSKDMYYIDIDYVSLLDGLATEISAEDSIGDIEYIEENLKEYDIVTPYSDSVLKDLGWIQDYTKISKRKIRISSYLINRKGKARDYYQFIHDTNLEYEKLINSTVNITLSLILKSIALKSFNEKQIVTLLDVDKSVISLAVTKKENTEDFIKWLRLPVIARVFGRQFCFCPRLTIIER